LKRTRKKRVLSIAGIDPVKLLGVNDRNLKVIEEHFDERIVVRGDEIILNGTSSRIDELTSVIESLVKIAGAGRGISEQDVLTVIRGGAEESGRIEKLKSTTVYYSTTRRKSIVPRSIQQKNYVDAIHDYDVIFAVGPAGTGKTYLAIAMALAAYKRNEIERIFVSRPVVEAGENLGFLPGDLQEKIDPYLRPIFDALRDMIGLERMQRMIESGVLEIAPLAYMRGRTLNNSFAILDEAQNSTVMQMKMFLTRLGVNSKAIITGDITQIDLGEASRSGLVAVREILDGVEGIRFIDFSEEDVVRHRLVRRIIRAFSIMGNKDRAARDGSHGAAISDDADYDCSPAPEESHGGTELERKG
jgi:phosphate starvation-inducible PhoH-like protein